MTTSISNRIDSRLLSKGMTVDKKAASNTNATADSTDSYWLACIARNNQDDLAAKKVGQTVIPEKQVTSAKPTAILQRLATKSVQLKPADTIWQTQTGAHPSYPTEYRQAGGAVSEGVGLLPGNTRVSIPAHIAYTAIIDDGRTHHVAWGVRNMSLSGVLLEMDVSHLKPGTEVDFLLRFTLKGRAVESRIPAKVVRTQLNGLALQFSEYDALICNNLAGLLYSNLASL